MLKSRSKWRFVTFILIFFYILTVLNEIYEEVKPLWTRSCLIKLLLSEKADKHLSHLYGFSPIVEQL